MPKQIINFDEMKKSRTSFVVKEGLSYTVDANGKADALFQLYNDFYRRTVRIEGHMSTNDQGVNVGFGEFKEYLRNHFSNDQIAQIAKHYSQAPMLFAGGIPTGMANVVEADMLIQQPDDGDSFHNMYVEAGEMYFKSIIKKWPIKSMNGDVIGILKGPIEVLFKLDKEKGFTFQKMQIDSESKIIRDIYLGKEVSSDSIRQEAARGQIEAALSDVNQLPKDSNVYRLANNYFIEQQRALAGNEVSSKNTVWVNSLVSTANLISELINLNKAITEAEKLRGNDSYVVAAKMVYAGVYEDAEKLLKNPKLDPSNTEKRMLADVLSATAACVKDPLNQDFVRNLNSLINNPALQGQPTKGRKWKGGLLAMAGFLTIAAGVALSIVTLGAGSPLGVSMAIYGGSLVAGAGTTLAGEAVYNTGLVKGVAKTLGKFYERATKNATENEATEKKLPLITTPKPK